MTDHGGDEGAVRGVLPYTCCSTMVYLMYVQKPVLGKLAFHLAVR